MALTVSVGSSGEVAIETALREVVVTNAAPGTAVVYSRTAAALVRELRRVQHPVVVLAVELGMALVPEVAKVVALFRREGRRVEVLERPRAEVFDPLDVHAVLAPPLVPDTDTDTAEGEQDADAPPGPVVEPEAEPVKPKRKRARARKEAE